MSEQSNNFEEIQEMFDYILKQEFISPENIELVASKFKNAILTIENKEDFFPFLNKFVRQVEGNDLYHEERVEALRTEIDSFYDRIGTNFSVYHVAGYKDPNDPDYSEKFSDEDHDFDFNTGDYRPPVFGPVIPEEKRPLVQKILEKIGALQQQKQTSRTQVLQKWRQLRLAHQISRLKRISPGLGMLQLFQQKQLGAFHKIRMFAESTKEKENEGQRQELEKLKEDLNRLKVELERTKADNQKNDQQLKKEKELERRIQELQNDLERRLNENEKLKNLFENQKKELLDKNKEDKDRQNQLDKLQQLLGQLEKREKQLNSEVQNKNSSVSGLQQALSESKQTIDNLLKEIAELKKLGDKKDPQNYSKIRHFLKIIKLFEIRLLAFGFMKVFKRKEKAKISLMNVTQRIKARLLIQTRTLNCGQDIMKSYLKWMLKSRPDFIRDCISKIPLTGRIDHQISFWRMKKLVFKPIVKKLSESAKALRRLKGFFQLHKLLEKRQQEDKYDFFKKLNPNFKTREDRKVEKVLEKMIGNMENGTRKALRALRAYKDFIKEILKRMMDSKYNQMRVAFWILRMKNREKRRMNEMLTIQGVFDKTAQRGRDSMRKFVERVRGREAKTVKVLNKLMDSLTAKRNQALSKMIRNKNEAVMNEVQNKYVEKFKEMLKQQAAKLLRDGQMELVRDAMDALRKVVRDAREKKQREERDNQKLKAFFNNLGAKKMLLKNSALDALRNHCAKGTKQDERRKELPGLIFKRMDLLKRHIFNRLRTNNKREKDEMENQKRLMNKMFQDLQRAQKEKTKESFKGLNKMKELGAKQREALNRLLRGKVAENDLRCKKRALNLLRDNLQNFKDEIKRKEQMKGLANMLKQGLMRKQKWVLMQLIARQRELKGKQAIEEKIKQNALNRLVDGNRLDERMALKKLLGNKLESIRKEKDRQNLLKNVFDKQFGGHKNSMKRCLDALRRHRLGLKNKVLDRVMFGMIDGQKKGLKQYLDALRQWNNKQKTKENKGVEKKENLLRKLLGGQEMKIGDVFNKLKKNAQRGIINEMKKDVKKIKGLDKLIHAHKTKVAQQFYRLILNGKNAQQKSEQLEKQKQQALNGFNKMNNKLKEAFNALRNWNGKEKEQQRRLKDLLGRLRDSQEDKLNRALQRLLKNNVNTGANRLVENLRNKLEYIFKENRTREALDKLAKAQQEKEKASMRALNNNLQEQRRAEKNRAEGKFGPLAKLIKKSMGKEKECFGALKQNNQNGIEKDQERLKELKGKMKLFGVSGNVLEKLEEFKEILEAGNKNKQRIDPKDKFLEAVEYMEMHDEDGKFEFLLKKIWAGDIQTLDELRKEAKKNNNTGQYSDLLRELRSPKLVQNNLLRWMELNNQDGRYNFLISEMKKNPDFTLLDVLKYLDKNAGDEKFELLKARLNRLTVLDEMQKWMEKNNQSGNFSRPLEALAQSNEPKLSDILAYCRDRKETQPFQRELRQKEEAKQLQKLLDYLRRNNGDGRHDGLLRHLESKSNPRLSDLASYLRGNPGNASEQVKKILNFQAPTLADKVQTHFNPLNSSGKYNPFLKKLEGRQKLGLVDFYRLVADTKGEALTDLNKFLDNPASAEEHIKWMKEKGGDYLKILKELRSIPNPKRTDLFRAMALFEKEMDVSELKNRLENDGINEELLDFLKRKNKGGKYREPIRELDKNKSAYETFKWLKNNGRGLDTQPIMNKIDGEEEDDLSPLTLMQDVLEQLKDDGSVQELRERLRTMQNPSFTRAMESVIRSPDQFENVIRLLNEKTSPEQLETLSHYVQNNAQIPDLIELRSYLVQKRPLTDFFEYIEDNEKRLKLLVPKQILNQENLQGPMEKCVLYAKLNNKDGKYNGLLSDLANKENPSLDDIHNFLQKNKNNNGEHDGLIRILNQTDDAGRVGRLKDWIDENNDNGNFDGLINYLKTLDKPTLMQVLRYASNNNKDGRYDPLLSKMLGRKYNSKSLFDLVINYNKNGKWNDLKKFLEDNPNATLDQVLEFMDRNNADGKYDDLIGYLLGENDEYKTTPRKQRERLEDLISWGDVPEAENFVKKEGITDPFRFQKWLESKKGDPKYDSIKKEVDSYIDGIKNGNELSGIPFAFKMKMKECLDRLRRNKDDQLKDLLRNKEKLKSMFVNALKSMRLAEQKALSSLKIHKEQSDLAGKEAMDKRRKWLLRLINSHESKLMSVMIKLHQNHQRETENEKKKLNALEKALGVGENKYNQKKGQLMDTLRNMNRVHKEVRNKMIKDLKDGLDEKMRQALRQLRDFNKDNKQKELMRNKLFNKMLISSYGKSVKDCFDALKNQAQKDKMKNTMTDKVKKNLLNQLKGYYKYSLKNCLDALRNNRKEKKAGEEAVEKIKQRMLQKLSKNGNDELKNCFDALRRLNKEQKMANLIGDKIKQKLFNKVLSHGKDNLRTYFDLLRKNNEDQKKKDEIKNEKGKDLVFKLVSGSKMGMKQALDALRKHNIKQKLQQLGRERALEKMLEKLKKGMQKKSEHSLGQLIQNRDEDLLNRKKIEKLLQNLSQKQSQKQKEVIQKLQQNRREGLGNERRNRDRLQKILERAQNKFIERPFYKLIENCLFKQKQDKIIYGNLNNMKGNWKLKESSKLNELYRNHLRELLVQSYKKAILYRLCKNQENKTGHALQAMQSFIYNKKNKTVEALKVVRKNMLQDVWYFYRILKMNKFLNERNNTSARLNQMLFCLRKNHKQLLRQAFNHWAGTEIKNKVKIASGKIEAIIVRRQHAGYHAIKNYYLYMKFQKYISGLIKLINLMEGRIHGEKVYFWNQLFEKNLWFQRVVDIWTIKAQPNFQIAFWKMRYAKELKKDAISAEKALRLKKLLTMFNNKLQGSLSNGFWKIHSCTISGVPKHRTTML